MTITLPGAGAPDLGSLVQLGSVCLCVIRQTLPGWLQGSQGAKLGNVQAIDSKEKSDLDGSALTKDLFGPANATVSA